LWGERGAQRPDIRVPTNRRIRYTYRRGVLLDGHPQTLEQLVLHGRRQRRDHKHQLQQLRRQRRLQ